MTKLTKRQHEILELIEAHMLATGSPPTRAEIAKTMGFRSPNAAEDHLRALARKGVIELVAGTSRGIRLTKSLGLPIIKRLINKQFVLADENIEGTSRLDKNFFKPSVQFLFQISSTEYQSFGLLNGDYVAIHQTDKALVGQIALIRLNNELVIRRFSEDMERQHSIEGLLVGVIRSLNSSSFS